MEQFPGCLHCCAILVCTIRQQESISFECPPGADRPFAINLRESPGSNQTSGRTLEFQAHNEEEWREWGLWIARALSYRSMGINGPRSACKRSQNNLEHLMSHVHDGHHEEVRVLTPLHAYRIPKCNRYSIRFSNPNACVLSRFVPLFASTA